MKQGTVSREQGAGSREQGAGSREQGAVYSLLPGGEALKARSWVKDLTVNCSPVTEIPPACCAASSTDLQESEALEARGGGAASGPGRAGPTPRPTGNAGPWRLSIRL